MKIGIIGDGVVGSACAFGFRKLGHDVVVHDVKYDTSIVDVLKTEIVFICVPTPSKEDGSCDTSVVEMVVSQLAQLEYKGVVAIKSTVIPGTTRKLRKRHESLLICFIPEFLRERCAIYDFVENHSLLAIGSRDFQVVDIVRQAHGNYPKKTVAIGATEAELLKYYSNVFNAMRVIFANEMFEVAEFLEADYKSVKDAFVAKGGIADIYLDVNDNFRGYGGVCLPKDVKALRHLCENVGLDLDLFRMLDDENKKFKTTVPEGMRFL